MRLDELEHLPIARGPLISDKEVDLPEVPVELADVEFEGCGSFRPIYVRGIQIPDKTPDEPYLVWANHINKETGRVCGILKTELDKVTDYRTQVSSHPFSPQLSELTNVG